MTEADSRLRQRALDPSRSFVVQAPAGSGKTELLIQRYLGLLAIVAEPEQVVAITFTRKAAAEMRSRVMTAFMNAGAERQNVAPHYAHTLELARTALAAGRRHSWEIAEHPERLRIETLDALNASLAQKLPLLSGGIAGASIIEDATALYREAALQAITALQATREGEGHLRRVLATVDGRIERLEPMVADLLGKREQWLDLIVDTTWLADSAGMRDRLFVLAQSRLIALEQRLTAAQCEALARLAALAAERAPDSAVAMMLARTEDGDRAARWRAVAALVLTRSGAWRKRWTQREGFGRDAAQARRELEALSETMQARAGVREALEAVAALPRLAIGVGETVMLESMRALLVQATAELRVLFSLHRSVDFAELALGARLALGQIDQPSDLLLAIDHRIQHILVDEFQDTSKSQMQLLELLTAGWQPDDGRTLFLVGDPMQSIYRFRNADMSLFLRARQFGVGAVHCESIVLGENFRAAPALVDWINETFARVFPASDDVENGRAQFHASYTTRPADEGSRVAYHILPTMRIEDEVDRVVAIVERERAAAATQTIGVLVQSRSHLVGLKRRLKNLGLRVRAVEIDALHDESFVQDLLGLCRALTHLADRSAWLATLRAPWCGVGWADLELLIRDADTATVWELMHDAARLASLSGDGEGRVVHLRAQLRSALAQRGGEPFVAWIERVWRMLGGPATVHAAVNAEQIDQFFTVLAAAARNEDIVDAVTLESHFEKPQREPDAAAEATVEIMTIHRAKGLEFDTVIVSGLNRTTRRDERQLVHWHDAIAPDGRAYAIVVPLMPERSGLYEYLRNLESQRTDAERARLLYVATTRARQRLHLVAGAGAGDDADKPQSGSLLTYLRPVIEQFEPAAAPASRVPLRAYVEPPLRRLKTPRPVVAADAARETPPLAELVEYEWVGAAAAPVGTVVHRYLQTIAETGIAGWTAARIDRAGASIRAELSLLGVDDAAIDAAASRVQTALGRVLADPTGRWILTAHEEAKSELGLSRVVEREIAFLRLDRTFVDGGVRWIVDYKSGSHEGGDVEAFIASEVERYRGQLEEYARAVAELDSRPIRLGLYFPLMQAFHDWEPGAG